MNLFCYIADLYTLHSKWYHKICKENPSMQFPYWNETRCFAQKPLALLFSAAEWFSEILCMISQVYEGFSIHKLKVRCENLEVIVAWNPDENKNGLKLLSCRMKTRSCVWKLLTSRTFETKEWPISTLCIEAEISEYNRHGELHLTSSKKYIETDFMTYVP